ncbi:MAG: ABC transporter ATP-binding protein [Pseudomonadota bacterium]
MLDGVDLTVSRGECVALRGRSGSGKSTLLNIISGIDSPDSGQVMIAGRDIATLTERERTLYRRRHLGFVYQAFNLIPTLTVADNVRLVLELNDVDRDTADRRIDELLDAVGLADRRSASPDLLSGGEQQRVAIARALAHAPELILADEPTGNLDEQSAAGVLRLLEELIRSRGGTMLIATHSKVVADFCDRSLEVRSGKVHDGI